MVAWDSIGYNGVEGVSGFLIVLREVPIPVHSPGIKCVIVALSKSRPPFSYCCAYHSCVTFSLVNGKYSLLSRRRLTCLRTKKWHKVPLCQPSRDTALLEADCSSAQLAIRWPWGGGRGVGISFPPRFRGGGGGVLLITSRLETIIYVVLWGKLLGFTMV